MFEIVNELKNVQVSVDSMKDQDLKSKIVILKQIGSSRTNYGILSKVPSCNNYYFKALNNTDNLWDGHQSISPKVVVKNFIDNNDGFNTEFIYVFDDMKEFATWFNKEMNE